MHSFSRFHPIVNFIFFVFVLLFTMIFTHPICIIISFLCSSLYVLYINGAKVFFKNFSFILPLILFTAILNPLFNHRGATILFYFKNGNPMTLESLIYGVAAALMMGSAIMWFICFNYVMDTDKIICLFSRSIPALSLIIAITMRLLPAYIKRIKDTWNIRHCSYPRISSKTQKLKSAFAVISSVTSWALESGIETADSMRSRNYGVKKRHSYSIYRFDRRDILYLITISAAASILIFYAASKYVKWQYFPLCQGNISFGNAVPAFSVYIFLCSIPFITELQEAIKWHLLKSKT